METNIGANPVGKVVESPQITEYVSAMRNIWNEIKPIVPWWQFWRRISLMPLVSFLLSCLDALIYIAEHTLVNGGPDKKATVMDAIGKIFDYAIVGLLPIWLRPFSGQIRSFIINVIVVTAIDWMISKYNSGNWNVQPPTVAQVFGSPGWHRPTI